MAEIETPVPIGGGGRAGRAARATRSAALAQILGRAA